MRQINAVYFHERDQETGKIIPQFDGQIDYDGMTAHDSTVARVMHDKGVSQDAAERIVFETQEVMRLRAKLNAQQQTDIVKGIRGAPDQIIHVAGPTDDEIDAQAEALRLQLVAARR